MLLPLCHMLPSAVCVFMGECFQFSASLFFSKQHGRFPKKKKKKAVYFMLTCCVWFVTCWTCGTSFFLATAAPTYCPHPCYRPFIYMLLCTLVHVLMPFPLKCTCHLFKPKASLLKLKPLCSMQSLWS